MQGSYRTVHQPEEHITAHQILLRDHTDHPVVQELRQGIEMFTMPAAIGIPNFLLHNQWWPTTITSVA